MTGNQGIIRKQNGAFAVDRRPALEAPAQIPSHIWEDCANITHLFADVYEEGSATYVEDVSILAQSHSESAAKQLTDINEGLVHLHDSATLLELSVVGLNAAEAVPFDDVYAVGFYGHGVLYDIGNGMARAIAENDGPLRLAVFLKQAPYTIALPLYTTTKIWSG